MITCEIIYDAKRFLKELEIRLSKFGLEISKEKTKMILFGRSAWKRMKHGGPRVESFDFLGFTHYCGTSRMGWFSMRHKTSKHSIRRKLKTLNEWLKKNRSSMPQKDW